MTGPSDSSDSSVMVGSTPMQYACMMYAFPSGSTSSNTGLPASKKNTAPRLT